MLKTVLVCAVALLLCGTLFAANSPIDKGSLFLSGSAYFQSQSGDLFEDMDGDGITSFGIGSSSVGLTENFELSPTVGYFVSPGVFIGAQFGYLGYSRGDYDFHIVGMGPTIGYYFKVNQAETEVKGSVYPYIRGFFNWANASNGASTRILQYGAKGGMLYMLSSAVAVDGSVMFRGDSWKPEGASESITGTTISIGAGFSAFIY